MSRLFTVLQFVLGFILGIALLSGVAVGAAYFYLTSISEYPPKPTFSEEESSPTAETEQEQASSSGGTETEETTTAETSQETEEATEAEPESEPEPPEELPPEAYRARVTWSEGLSLRAEPSTNAERIGGIAFNAEIIILEESEDKQWQRVRVGESDREGWVKAGNVERVN
ncbi:SH3 domain-containing protein [Pleurocapsales cyanobacterium LEGE 06147]|nr:SH3 domain-containing protein [Pleurocapsales cyanobacterium LEGE 06147]